MNKTEHRFSFFALDLGRLRLSVSVYGICLAVSSSFRTRYKIKFGYFILMQASKSESKSTNGAPYAGLTFIKSIERKIDINFF